VQRVVERYSKQLDLDAVIALVEDTLADLKELKNFREEEKAGRHLQ